MKTRIYDAAVVIEYVWVYVSVWEGGWGEAGGWLPLPTRPQQYCDPASLVPLGLPSFTTYQSYLFHLLIDSLID